MKVDDLWWECPKCKSKIEFGSELATLFCRDDNEAYFCPESGVPFYVVTCSNDNCNATWNFGISNMIDGIQ